jgi:putative copper resistance protein D
MNAPTLPGLFASHWQISWAISVETALCALVYLVGAARLGRRWPLRYTLSFLAGLASIVVALESGLDTYDDQLLSVHMTQHMLLLLGAPLFLLVGRPMALALRVLHGHPRRRFARALERARPLTRPWWCLAAFYAIVLCTHLTGFYEQTLSHPFLHEAEHALYLLAGGLMWWPLLDGDPVLTQRLSGLGRLLYLLVGMLPMAVVGAYLNRYPHVVYAAYATPARALGISAVSDQATAGAIMWVVGNSIMLFCGILAIMAALSAEERRMQAREAYAGRSGVAPPGTDERLAP